MGVIGPISGLGGLDNSTCKRILDLLEASYIRLGDWEIVTKRITVIKFGVDDRCGNGGGFLESRYGRMQRS